MTKRGPKLRGVFLHEGALISPRVDFVTTSALSIVVMIGLCIFAVWHKGGGGSDDLSGILPKLLALQVLLNWPHFLVSYRLLYSRKSNFSDFPTATMIAPLVLAVIAIIAMLPMSGGAGPLSLSLKIAYPMWLFASFYLAWHYTGQTWGVMMSFARISGLRLTPNERLILRMGLRTLIFWHVVWGLQTLPDLPVIAVFQGDAMMWVANCVATLSFATGAYVLGRKVVTTGVDIRVLGAFLAIYLWYLVLFLMPDAFIFIQLSHALQYMIFPTRVEINEATHAKKTNREKTRSLIAMYLMSVAGGVVIFYIPDAFFAAAAGAPTVASYLAIAINIHHYYTDSAIWKLRTQRVAGSLFAHLETKQKG